MKFSGEFGMRVVVVDEQTLMREFVARVCVASFAFEVVGEAGTGNEAIKIIASKNPDIVIMDLMLPDLDGLEALAKVRGEGFSPKALVLSSYVSPFLVYRIERARVDGLVDKQIQTGAELQQAIQAISCNRPYFSESFVKMRTDCKRDPLAFYKLMTEQQILVLSMVANLKSDAEIANALFISARTVEAHRTAIMRKFGIHSRTELIRFAWQQGIGSGPAQQQALPTMVPC